MTAPDEVPAEWEPGRTDISVEVETLAYAAIETEAKRRKELGKALLAQHYPDGRTERTRSPLGEKLGSVLRTDPDPRWLVVDRDALHAHLRTFADSTETVYEIADWAEAISVLREYAPHVLVEITRVKQEWVDDAVAQSRATSAPAAPGIERQKDRGVMTAKPDKAAFAAVARLVQAGLISWDGRPSLPSSNESGAA